MRKTIFRGRDFSGKWHFGDLVHDAFGNYAISKPMIKPDEDEGFAEGCQEHFHVDPETVGQSTGLCDMYGVELFESDTCKWYDSYEDEVFTVEYEDGAFKLFYDDGEERLESLCELLKDEHGYLRHLKRVRVKGDAPDITPEMR